MIWMSDRPPLKASESSGSPRRSVLGGSIIATVVVVAATAGYFIGTKGVEQALPVIFSGIALTFVLVLHWFRSKKEDMTVDKRDT